MPHSRLLLERAVIDAGRDAAGAARRDRQAPDGFYSLGGEFSEDVPAAHAEHQQLADMLAVTLRLGTSTPVFGSSAPCRMLLEHHGGCRIIGSWPRLPWLLPSLEKLCRGKSGMMM